MSVSYKFAAVNNAEIFYRESGKKNLPNLLLLHGFPTSSRQFRDLITLLSPHFHIVAPDLPGYGKTSVPQNYVFTFDSLADTINDFLDAIDFDNFAMYIFDYGAPTGLRIALRKQKNVTAIISQNGNAYDEGFGNALWPALKDAWAAADEGLLDDKTLDTYKKITGPIVEILTDIKGVEGQYNEGEKLEFVDPELAATDFQTLVAMPNSVQNQLDLILDYRKNASIYPEFHKYFRESNVPILAVWGKNDPIFVFPGAEAYKRDSKNVKVVGVEGGHFVSSTHPHIVADEILKFFAEFK